MYWHSCIVEEAIMCRHAFFVALLAIVPSADAQESGPPVPAEEIVRSLQPNPSQSLTRAFSPHGGEGGAIDNRPKIGVIIQFDYNSATIKPESYPQLQECAKALLTGLKEAVVAIAGHTDSDGPEAYNLQLSQQRAEAVKAFLVGSYSVQAERLRVEAYGESRPVAPNDNESGRARNRRVEFIRIGKVE
jgi:outer membrane protein OmpA-like peptidoglycan-associated protein